jgi:hypothetical protein
LRAAFADAALRGTKSVPGREVTPDFRNCRLGNSALALEHIGSCMTYHMGQCEVNRVSLQENQEWAALVDIPNINIMSSEFRNKMNNRSVAQYAARRSEAGAVKMMCGTFNQYLREKACVNDFDNAYRRCITRGHSINDEAFISWMEEKNIHDPLTWKSAAFCLKVFLQSRKK